MASVLPPIADKKDGLLLDNDIVTGKKENTESGKNEDHPSVSQKNTPDQKPGSDVANGNTADQFALLNGKNQEAVTMAENKKNSDSTRKSTENKPEIPEKTAIAKPDSQMAKPSKVWRKAIVFSLRFPAMGTTFVNQASEQDRIARAKTSPVFERPMIDLAVRLERNLLSWLAFHGQFGMNYTRDFLAFDKNVNNQPQIFVQGNQLIYKNTEESSRGFVQTHRIGNQIGMGFSILPGGQLPEIKMTGGAYFSIWENATFSWNGAERNKDQTLQFVSPFLMISASKSISISGHKFSVEPQFLWIPNSLFNYREGIKRQINYFGLGLGYRW
jgi:hypothetical protein